MRYVTSIGLAIAVALSAGSALAVADFRQETSQHVGDSFGNYNFYADYGYSTLHWNEHHTAGNGGWSADGDSSFALATLGANAQVFGKCNQLLLAQAGAHPFLAGPTFSEQILSTVNVMGNNLYYVSNNDNNACGGASCASWQTSISKTFFTAQATFTVGFVPVTVTASVSGTAYAGISASAYASRFLFIGGSFLGQATSSLSAGAYATAYMSAFAGIPDVLGVGVSSNFRLLGVDVTPTVSAAMIRSSTANTQWSNRMPLTISTMNGSAKVWADISPWWSPSQQLISWSGYSWTKDLYNYSGSQKYY